MALPEVGFAIRIGQIYTQKVYIRSHDLRSQVYEVHLQDDHFEIKARPDHF